MSDSRISYADLSTIENRLSNLSDHLNNLSHNVNAVAEEVDHANYQINETDGKLERLIQEFRDFLDDNLKAKNLQLAETRLVKLRQELETEFGHYADTRRSVVGILQAVDTNIVRKESIKHTSEEQMLLAPRYWLAPNLVALSAWISDDLDLAQRALNEGLKRDDEKTSLFFALITRRIGRFDASSEWLSRYIGLQNPYELDQTIIRLIDGFTNGVFGVEATNRSREAIDGWIEELSSQQNFIDQQRNQWRRAIENRVPNKSYGDTYPYLMSYSKDWSLFEKYLRQTLVHEEITAMFRSILEKPIVPDQKISDAVDRILDDLVNTYDEDENVLRRKERIEQLIVDTDGDKDRAEQIFNQETALNPTIDFSQILTNIVMVPEVVPSTDATKKLSLSLSKEWIIDAHNDFVADYRLKASEVVDTTIVIDQWEGKSEQAANEEELRASLKTHIEHLKANDLYAMKEADKGYGNLFGIAGTVVATIVLKMTFILIATAYFVWAFYRWKKEREHKSQSIENHFDQLFKHQEEILRATVAEHAEWLQDFQKQTADAPEVENLLTLEANGQLHGANYTASRKIL